MRIPLKMETMCGGAVIGAQKRTVQNVQSNIAAPDT